MQEYRLNILGGLTPDEAARALVCGLSRHRDPALNITKASPYTSPSGEAGAHLCFTVRRKLAPRELKALEARLGRKALVYIPSGV